MATTQGNSNDKFIIVKKPDGDKSATSKSPDDNKSAVIQIGPFGLNNVGSICYFNSLLQALLSCKSIYNVIQDITIDNDLNKTLTGRTFIQTVRTAMGGNVGECAAMSSKLLSALIADLENRLGKIDFGKMQESASEGLVWLLDMMENPESKVHPITRLFRNHYCVEFFCETKCKDIVSVQEDTGISINLFFYDSWPKPIKDSATFADAIRVHLSNTDSGYKCPRCKETVIGIRRHTLTRVPEILVCLFNQYADKKLRYFPQSFKIPNNKGGIFTYQIVAQIEHSGNLGGGHYVCKATRKNNQHFLFNDNAFTEIPKLEPSVGTYMIFYQLC
jgi:ubiquitin C-terminal hydrolase